MVIVDKSSVAFPMILFAIVFEASCSVDMNSMFYMCQCNGSCSSCGGVLFELDFSDALFLATEESGGDDWSGLRATMNNDFMIGEDFTVIQRFLPLRQ